MERIQFKKLNPAAVIPQRATAGSAGLDLRACLTEPVTLRKDEHAAIPTGLAVKVEDGFAAMLFARSGLAIKHGIGLLNGVGVVDSDYRGEIRVGVINQFEEPYTIEPGERIAQMVVMPVSLAPVVEVDELDETDRGAGGFGSTGR